MTYFQASHAHVTYFQTSDAQPNGGGVGGLIVPFDWLGLRVGTQSAFIK